MFQTSQSTTSGARLVRIWLRWVSILLWPSAALNHKIKGVEGIYNRHDYFDERKVALNTWASLLQALEEGKPDYNVFPLKKSAAAT